MAAIDKPENYATGAGQMLALLKEKYPDKL